MVVGRTRKDAVKDYNDKVNRIVGYIARSAVIKNRCYAYILLLVLRNGLRLGEAIRAYQHFLKTGETVFTLPVVRRKKTVSRMVVLPDLGDIGTPRCEDIGEEPIQVLAERIRMFAKNHFGFSTKELRWSFISYLLAVGYDPALVREVTGHSDFLDEQAGRA